MWMIASLLRIFFPPTCIGCGKSGVALCERCIKLARKSLSVPHPYITSVFDFKDPLVKRAIHAVKYYHRKDLIIPLAETLAKELRTSSHEIENYTLIPIPMPRMRRLLRGYNQAEQTASLLATLLSIPVRNDILIRTKSPLRQVRTTKKEERLRNQRDSFAVAHNVSGMKILLIDDVTTTGATLEEARKTLLKSGALEVRAATLAH
jgi:ComF family protein